MSLAKRSNVIDLTEGDYDKPSSPNPKNKKKQKKSATVAESASNFDISLVSYNVWFDPLYQPQRMQALYEAVLNTAGSLPRWIGLQEVTPTLASVLFPLFRETGYTMVEQPNTPYGCVLCLQVDAILDSGFIPYDDTVMGRGILWAWTRVQGRSILFTTTHLESYFRNPDGTAYTGVAQREKQLLQIKQFCEGFLNDGRADVAIITGDLNWDDERARSKGDDKPVMELMGSIWIDTWRQHRPNEAGYTYDSKESPMLRGNLRRRFDRCLIRSKLPVTVKDTELVGKDVIPGLTRSKDTHPMARNRNAVQTPVLPSDHFGLRVTLHVHVNNNE